MSTNYYTKEGDHIGKRISNGRGKGSTFIWAMHKKDVYQRCARMLDRPFINGEEKPLNGEQFLKMLAHCAAEDFSMVGEEFT